MNVKDLNFKTKIYINILFLAMKQSVGYVVSTFFHFNYLFKTTQNGNFPLQHVGIEFIELFRTTNPTSNQCPKKTCL